MKRKKFTNTFIKDLGRVKIINELPDLTEFKNIKCGSKYAVVTPPKGYTNWIDGVWIQGVSRPVQLLPSDYKKVKAKRTK